jgi:hypothetical protein
MKGLEHKAQMRAPPDGAPGFIERGQIRAVVQNPALLPAVQPGQAVEKVDLPTPELPTMATNSPAAISQLTCAKTVVWASPSP